jgi:hypothetical protein
MMSMNGTIEPIREARYRPSVRLGGPFPKAAVPIRLLGAHYRRSEPLGMLEADIPVGASADRAAGGIRETFGSKACTDIPVRQP